MATFIWSNWIRDYHARLEAMAYAEDVLPVNGFARELSLAPLAPKPQPYMQKPNRVFVWN